MGSPQAPGRALAVVSRAMSGEIRIEFVDGHADVWRLFDDPAQLRELAEALVEPFRGGVTKVAGIESRGFILGTAAALALGVGFVPVRKEAGLFPGPKAVAEAGTDYRGNRHRLRVQRAALDDRDRVLLVDDWIETGSQAAAAKQLVEACGAELVGIATVVTELSPEAARGLGRRHALVTR
jgi:adenine phosphoribosyltransferase